MKKEVLQFEDKVPYLNVDIPELLSRKVVDTTVNEVILRVKNDKDDEIAIKRKWEMFIDDLKKYNDIEKLHKTDTKYKSKLGKSIVGFDIWENHPILWFADNDGACEAVRINGMKQFAITCNRTYAVLNGGAPILRNKLVITDTAIAFLFQGGFGVNLKNSRAIKDINDEKTSIEQIKNSWVPFQWTRLGVPQYIVDQFRVGTWKHNYGVLPAMEMLNKDFIDNDAYGRVTLGGDTTNDIVYSDWYPASSICEIFNGFIQYFGAEMVLDHTRVIGTFSQQEINKILGKDENEKQTPENFMKNLLELQKKIDDNKYLTDGEKGVIKKGLILKSIGGEGSQLDKMQTTLKGLEHTQTMDQLITLAFKISGYSWDTDGGKVYENVSQTMNSSRGVYESTKEKIVLFERQWKEFYSKVAFAWFRYNGYEPSSIEEVKKEFEEYVDFQIVSNVLQQENNDYQKVVELAQSNLISKYKAIKDLNPDMSNEEIEEEVNRIEEEQNKQFNSFDNFGNKDFLGYEENENPAVDNMGQKNVNGDN